MGTDLIGIRGVLVNLLNQSSINEGTTLVVSAKKIYSIFTTKMACNIKFNE